jgi:MFS family permease
VNFLFTKTSKDIVKEGAFDAVKIGAAETYFSAFGVFLGGTPLQIGALATLPPLVGAMFQAVGMRLSERITSRRAAIVRAMKLQAMLVLPIGLIPYLCGTGWWAVTALIAIISLYHMTIGFIAPMWNSLVGDLIPPTSRGEFFGFRNKWMSIVTFAGVFGAGYAIHYSKAWGITQFGFAVVFLIAAVSRYVSGRAFERVPDAVLHVPDDSKFTFWQFIIRARHSNFVKFVFFISCMNFATALSGPYFAMYMLKELAFSYQEYMFVVAAVVLAQFSVMRAWGALSDQFGNRQILRVCGFLISINPFLWLVSSNIWWVVFIQLYSGIFWAGFNLAAANFVFDAVTAPKRARCFAYQSIINGVLVFLGSALGGYIATRLPSGAGSTLAVFVSESPFLILFVVSGLLRFMTMVVLLPTFAEVRRVQKIRSHQLLIRVTSLRPLWGATFGVLANRYSKRDVSPE